MIFFFFIHNENVGVCLLDNITLSTIYPVRCSFRRSLKTYYFFSEINIYVLSPLDVIDEFIFF
jgi:hypothetical protein